MRIYISGSKTINDIQKDFNDAYPYLKLEFYKSGNGSLTDRKRLAHSTLLKSAGLINKTGQIDLRDEMTVAELEHILLSDYGLDVQVSRKSGMSWLETTMTDNWSLGKQNEHGREISAIDINNG